MLVVQEFVEDEEGCHLPLVVGAVTERCKEEGGRLARDRNVRPCTNGAGVAQARAVRKTNHGAAGNSSDFGFGDRFARLLPGLFALSLGQGCGAL
jgi:hypothetical protein